MRGRSLHAPGGSARTAADELAAVQADCDEIHALGFPCEVSADGRTLIVSVPDDGDPILNPLTAEPLRALQFCVDASGQMQLTSPACVAGLPAIDFPSPRGRDAIRAEITALLERSAKQVRELRERLQRIGMTVTSDDGLERVRAALEIDDVGRVRVEADGDVLRLLDGRPAGGGPPISLGRRAVDLVQCHDRESLQIHLSRIASGAFDAHARATRRSGPVTRLRDWMDRTWYPSIESNWDDRLFRDRIAIQLGSGYQILDLGAGAGIIPAMNFRGRVARVCGVDPSERVHQNPHLDEARQAFGEAIPYAEASFDLVFSDNVLEHLPDPRAVFREVHRILKPSGLFLAKTPNRRHYVASIARLTPHWVHRVVNAWRGRAHADTFPTLYRANTRESIAALAAQTGFRLRDCELIEGRPEYLRMSPLTYVFGWLYERLVNATPRLERFRVVMIATLERDDAPAR